MDKETKALIEFYHNRIKDLENKNKDKQNQLNQVLDDCDLLQHKLDKIKKLITATTFHTNEDILKIIKGEDK